jgi:hypothetical protein
VLVNNVLQNSKLLLTKRSLIGLLTLFCIVTILTGAAPVSAVATASLSKDFASELLGLSPYIVINEEGLFVLDYDRALSSAEITEEALKWAHQDLARINEHLKELPREQRPHIVETGDGLQIAWSVGDIWDCDGNSLNACLHVPRWVFDTVGWIGIIYGGGLVTVGLFAHGTIVGIPVGALLQAIGLWNGVTGTFLLWYVATYYPDGKTVCW